MDLSSIKDLQIETNENKNDFTADGIIKELGNLRLKTGNLLNDLSDILTSEIEKLNNIRKAIKF